MSARPVYRALLHVTDFALGETTAIGAVVFCGGQAAYVKRPGLTGSTGRLADVAAVVMGAEVARTPMLEFGLPRVLQSGCRLLEAQAIPCEGDDLDAGVEWVRRVLFGGDRRREKRDGPPMRPDDWGVTTLAIGVGVWMRFGRCLVEANQREGELWLFGGGMQLYFRTAGGVEHDLLASALASVRGQVADLQHEIDVLEQLPGMLGWSER